MELLLALHYAVRLTNTFYHVAWGEKKKGVRKKLEVAIRAGC